MMLTSTSSLVSRAVGAARVSHVAFRPAIAARAPMAPKRGALVVVAAEPEVKDKNAPKKRIPFPVKRAMIAEERRRTNKARKSACATRIKKVIKMAESLLTTVKEESEVKGLETLISEAFKEIDKAVVKGIVHKNTAARKKARCSRHKKKVLMAAGIWNPPAEHPDHKAWLRLQVKKPVTA